MPALSREAACQPSDSVMFSTAPSGPSRRSRWPRRPAAQELGRSHQALASGSSMRACQTASRQRNKLRVSRRTGARERPAVGSRAEAEAEAGAEVKCVTKSVV
ncbi:unnamed protein product [Protopolystoma xenopodis]|uniref:Uncharacterized protein n=1 Tax=Protopolystoma xenopodis TaxID=117903 RepID=A0A3S5AV76_9PLAT|nr:unnamed protein product [Protopolystoma xenopodis]